MDELEIKKMDIAEIKRMALLQSLETINAYINLCETLRDDLLNGDDSTQIAATISTQVLHKFMNEECGFVGWAQALRVVYDNALKEATENNKDLH